MRLIMAMGGRCQWVRKDGTECGWNEIPYLLEIHHEKEVRGYKRARILTVYEFHRTGKVPKDTRLFCPNHHAEKHYLEGNGKDEDFEVSCSQATA
jgi:hypothetical protein